MKTFPSRKTVISFCFALQRYGLFPEFAQNTCYKTQKPPFSLTFVNRGEGFIVPHLDFSPSPPHLHTPLAHLHDDHLLCRRSHVHPRSALDSCGAADEPAAEVIDPDGRASLGPFDRQPAALALYQHRHRLHLRHRCCIGFHNIGEILPALCRFVFVDGARRNIQRSIIEGV